MPLPLYQVDAFAPRAFGGNPAAVCLLAQPADEAWMKNVAMEMNLSETAFLHPEGGDGAWRLRWFTPAVEVALCGHATLASAHILWETGRVAAGETARFLTLSGPLEARQVEGLIEINLPAKQVEAAEPAEGLLAALGVQAVAVGRNQFDWLVEVASEEVVRQCQPDHARLRRLPARGVIVTARSSGGEFDFVSRFFAPGSGIDEDPVTGSAHSALGPWWGAKLGKTRLRAFQASARGGVLDLTVAADRVRMAGGAVTVLRGELLV
ncbi:MAG: PhzF family phenazine biosynthesis protein [Verrucomicrobia bacterium]|nr:PhzF family phenazine biosynthesis protein [Verrucomicrobiota bacterium]